MLIQCPVCRNKEDLKLSCVLCNGLGHLDFSADPLEVIGIIVATKYTTEKELDAHPKAFRLLEAISLKKELLLDPELLQQIQPTFHQRLKDEMQRFITQNEKPEKLFLKEECFEEEGKCYICKGKGTFNYQDKKRYCPLCEGTGKLAKLPEDFLKLIGAFYSYQLSPLYDITKRQTEDSVKVAFYHNLAREFIFKVAQNIKEKLEVFLYCPISLQTELKEIMKNFLNGSLEKTEKELIEEARTGIDWESLNKPS